MAVALERAPELGYYTDLSRDYHRRRDALKGVLDGANLPTLPVDGAYFLMSDISHLGFETDVEFAAGSPPRSEWRRFRPPPSRTGTGAARRASALPSVRRRSSARRAPSDGAGASPVRRLKVRRRHGCPQLWVRRAGDVHAVGDAFAQVCDLLVGDDFAGSQDRDAGG